MLPSITESAEGLIVDARLTEGKVAADTSLLLPTLKDLRTRYGREAAQGVVTDRGFNSSANSRDLEGEDIDDFTLPRDPVAMEEFLNDPKHRELHIRRGRTEARIGIFKAKFLGSSLPTKGIIGQKRYIAWATLAHNLWVLARLPRQGKTKTPQAA